MRVCDQGLRCGSQGLVKEKKFVCCRHPGDEDHLGDMDFKWRYYSRYPALQMDLKIEASPKSHEIASSKTVVPPEHLNLWTSPSARPNSDFARYPHINQETEKTQGRDRPGGS